MTQVSVLDLGGEQKSSERKKPIEFKKSILQDGGYSPAIARPNQYDNVMLVSRGSMDIIAAWDNGNKIHMVGVYLGHWNDGVVE